MSKTPPNRNQILNVLRLIIFLGALPLLVGVTGCASSRYTQSSAERINDNATSSRVGAALADDGQHRYFEDVKVDTFKGVVQLSGFVNTKDLKIRAGDIARNTVGVSDVRDSITVKE
jgi:hyperosmotically inducible protein